MARKDERIHPYYVVKRSWDAQRRCVKEVVAISYTHKEACALCKEFQDKDSAAFYVIDSSSRKGLYKDKFLASQKQVSP